MDSRGVSLACAGRTFSDAIKFPVVEYALVASRPSHSNRLREHPFFVTSKNHAQINRHEAIIPPRPVCFRHHGTLCVSRRRRSGYRDPTV